MGKTIGAIFSAILIIVCIIFCCSCITTVPAGYVAVQYNINGGIQDDILTQGWHFVSPGIKTTCYTIGLEQSYLTSGSQGDSKNDESFSACSSEGKDIKIDLTFTYQFDQNNVPQVFKYFKGKDGTNVRDSFIKPNIISWTKEVIARYKVADILGSQRAAINTALTEYLSEKFAPYYIIVSNVSLINIDVDAETAQAINNKITAQQNAETQAINNQTNVDRAKAEAEVRRMNAQGEADALLIEANARAEANNIVKASLSTAVLQSEWISRWNGQLPTYTGGSDVLFGIDGAIK